MAHRIGGKPEFRCVFRGCRSGKTWSRKQQLYIHMDEHIRGALPGKVPQLFFDGCDRATCTTCQRNFSKSRYMADDTHCKPCFRTIEAQMEEERKSADSDGDEVMADVSPSQPLVSDENDSLVEPPGYPSWDELRGTSIPTREKVPNPLQLHWSKALSSLFAQLARHPEDVTAWKDLHMIRALLFLENRGGRTNYKRRMTRTRLRFQRWAKGERAQVWAEVRAEALRQQAKRRENSQGAPLLSPEALKARQTKANIKRARYFGSRGEYRKAVQALTSNGLADLTEETMKVLVELHPAEDEPTIRECNATPIVVSPEVTMRAIERFGRSAKGGIDEVTAQHLRDATAFNDATHLTRNLTAFINMIFRGDRPDEVAKVFCGARLVAVKKKSGGVRPIAVGSLWLRAAAKTAMVLAEDSIKEGVGPLQVGLCNRAGAEIFVKAVKRADAFIQRREQKGMLSVDFANAFNSLSREYILDAVLKYTPQLYNYFRFCYATHSALRCTNGDIIWSRSGVRQGDGLGPAGFALGLAALLEENEELRQTLELDCWYLDDGTMAGDIDDLEKVVQWLTTRGKEVGLKLKAPKCEVLLSPGAQARAWMDQMTVSNGDMVILGVPHGSKDFIESQMRAKLGDWHDFLALLKALEDPQLAFALIRGYNDAAKVTYCLRNIPAGQSIQWAREFDAALHECMEGILGRSISKEQFTQAGLSTKMGGLGVRTSNRLRSAAWLSSHFAATLQCTKLLGGDLRFFSCEQEDADLELALRDFNERVVAEDRIQKDSFTETHTPSQRFLSQKVEKKVLKDLITASSPRDRAILLGVSGNHSGAWMRNLPVAWTGGKMSKAYYKLSVYRTLRMTLRSTNKTCEGCGEGCIDDFGDHALRCKHGTGRGLRHNLIKNWLNGQINDVGCTTQLEKPGLLDNSDRPADIYVFEWEQGQNVALDVGVTSVSRPTIVQKASTTRGAACAEYAAIKVRKYRARCEEKGFRFIPLVVESTGTWTKEAKKFLDTLASRIAAKKSMSLDDAKCQMYRSLSSVLQKGNAIAMLHHHRF